MMRIFFTFIIILTNLNSYGQDDAIKELSKLYTSHDLKSVIEKAKPMLEKDPNNIELNLILGRSYTDQGDFTIAIPYLESTVKNEKDNSWQKAWALGYLGTCYFMTQDYDNSKKSIKKCLDLNATKNSTRYAYANNIIFGFDDFFNDWKMVESENIRFHFQKMSDTEIKSFVSTSEEAFRIINKFFNSKLPKKIDFFVWESKEDAKNLFKRNLGFSNPDFCLIHSHSQQTKGHEMTHVVSNYSTKIIKKSELISEGTAVCFNLSKKNKEQKVKDWLKANNKKISIVEIWNNWENYPEEFTYPISGLFVRELIDNFGQERFIAFFSNQTYKNAKLVFGEKLDTLIKDFENKINN